MLTLNLYRARRPLSVGLRRDWRWKLTHSNTNIVANGGQGYSRQEDCLHGALLAIGGFVVADEHNQVSIARRDDTVNLRIRGFLVTPDDLPAGFYVPPTFGEGVVERSSTRTLRQPPGEGYEWTVPGLSDHETRELNYPEGRTPPAPLPGD